MTNASAPATGRFSIPPGGAARLHAWPATPPYCWAVVVADTPDRATIEAALTPGGVSAMLTHDGGVSFTDRTGEALAAATLDSGGVVLAVFETLADAMGCHARLTGGGR